MDSLGVSNEQFSKSKLDKGPSVPGSSAISSSTVEGEIFNISSLETSHHPFRRKIPAAGPWAGAAQSGGDEAGEAERDVRLLNREDVRGAGEHQLWVLQCETFLLPELPAELPLL